MRWTRNLLHQRVLVEPCLIEVNGKVLDQPQYFRL